MSDWAYQVQKFPLMDETCPGFAAKPFDKHKCKYCGKHEYDHLERSDMTDAQKVQYDRAVAAKKEEKNAIKNRLEGFFRPDSGQESNNQGNGIHGMFVFCFIASTLALSFFHTLFCMCTRWRK